MKPTRNLFIRLISLSAITLLGMHSAQAVSASWSGATNNTWTTTTNWSTSPVPATGNTATFNAASANTTVSTGNITINTILFDTVNAAAYTLGTAVGTGQITLNDSGAITINSAVVSNQVINANVVLGTTSAASSYSFTNNSATNGQLLTIAGSISSNQANATRAKTLTLGGSANGLVSGIINGNGSGSGSNETATVSLLKSGLGAWTLSNANTYAGTTTVSAGTLFANNTTGSATGTGAVSVGVSGRLGGTGTITPNGANGISVTGVLAPGGSVGTGNLTFNLGSTTGTVTMANAAGVELTLGVAGINLASFGTSDLLTIAAAAGSDFAFNNNNVNFLNTGAVGFYKLFDTSSNNANTWTGLTFNATTGLVSSGLNYNSLTSGLTGAFIVGTSANGGNTGDIYFQVIPEPGAALIGGIGALFLLRRRRSA